MSNLSQLLQAQSIRDAWKLACAQCITELCRDFRRQFCFIHGAR